MMDKSPEVIVVGAGAAGLMAAATAAERGRQTLLIEKNRKLGVKILMSGGTRCNLTHDTDWQGIANAFGKQQGRFLKFALASFDPDQVIMFFNGRGVTTKREDTGKIFPMSDKALHVRDALVEHALAAGAEIINETAITGIEKSTSGFKLFSEQQTFECQSLIVTIGGQSYPGCGTTGDGYAWLEGLGHSIETPCPALTPVRIGDDWVKQLSGMTMPDVKIEVASDRKLATQDRNDYRGSFLFTHTGCSGPAPMNVSRSVTHPENNFPKQLVCDWIPDVHAESLKELLAEETRQQGSRQLISWLSELVPRRLAESICETHQVSPEVRMAELNKQKRSMVLNGLKQSQMQIKGTLGFAKAEVTAGGVALGEVNQKTMASKLVPGLFLAGEILDIDGPIGGYNFQAAFSTGRLAGQNA